VFVGRRGIKECRSDLGWFEGWITDVIRIPVGSGLDLVDENGRDTGDEIISGSVWSLESVFCFYSDGDDETGRHPLD
jgi:hypothetical protein